MRSDIGSESRFLHTPPAFDATIRVRGGVPSEYRHTVWYRKTIEWCGYPMVKKIEDMFLRFDRMYERDGHTHRTTTTA